MIIGHRNIEHTSACERQSLSWKVFQDINMVRIRSESHKLFDFGVNVKGVIVRWSNLLHLTIPAFTFNWSKKWH